MAAFAFAAGMFLLGGAHGETFDVDIKIDATTTLHQANDMYMGCHSDSGFVHEVRGWSSQMIFGESFESPPNTTKHGQSSYAWQDVVDTAIGDRATIALDTATAFSGQASQKIHIAAGSPGTGSAGVANRGLGNEGFYLKADMEYEGYFFASSAKPVTLEVRLETTDGKKVLASQQIKHAPNGTGFVQHTFSLTPASGTECVGIAPDADPTVHCTSNPGTAHVCIKCGGQFTVALVSDGAEAEVNIDYVVFQPGAWGRFKGLNARKDVADALTTMGIKAIRLGGSFCSVTKDNGEYYQWQKWTGPVWERPSIGAHWDSYGGNAYNLIGGWGPFEMIDYATALGAEPIITTTMTSTPDSFADLVDYCWANSSTAMGRKRAADGHPEPYRLRFIELGNEQYNSNYIEQVAAMEKRAIQVGAAGQLHYIFPDNNGLTGGDIAKAAALKLGNRLVTDLHVGAGGALPVAEGLFAAHAKGGLTDDAAVNFETNAATHTHGRALDEAADLNAFFNAGEKRMLARTASFCHGRAGHYDMFDQAISFFMPNMTWLQPPGHVHAMITASWQPAVINSSISYNNAAKPAWTTLEDKALTCSGSEYQGDLGTTDAAGCLAAAKKKGTVNYAVWHGESNKNCFVCSITGRGDPSTWKYTTTKGAVSFSGVNIISPLSVSAQQSADTKTVVARIVNHGAALKAVIKMAGFDAPNITCVSMASNDLGAENTAADVDHVAPVPLNASSCYKEAAMVAAVELPGFSYTTVTLTTPPV